MGAAVLGIVAVPVAVTIAILRYRLYDIDVLIRRTLIYAALSAVLLVVYATGVGLIQFALSPVTSGNGLAVAISSMVVRVLRDHTGRGPTKSRTHMTEDLISVVVQDTLTHAEQIVA